MQAFCWNRFFENLWKAPSKNPVRNSTSFLLKSISWKCFKGSQQKTIIGKYSLFANIVLVISLWKICAKHFCHFSPYISIIWRSHFLFYVKQCISFKYVKVCDLNIISCKVRTFFVSTEKFSKMEILGFCSNPLIWSKVSYHLQIILVWSNPKFCCLVRIREVQNSVVW